MKSSCFLTSRASSLSIFCSLLFLAGQTLCDSSFFREDASASARMGMQEGESGALKRKSEDSIPVVEIRGEGQPMTSAQIRNLEEISNGGPLDIKIEKTWTPGDCPRAAKRLDFVTFHYKGFSETGKKFDQTYGRVPGVKIQLGVGMIIPGLDKGMKGMCDGELRKIQIPHRLSRKNKSKMWKLIPNDEHWLTFNIEMITVEEWTIRRQFEFMDMNNDTIITQNELIKWVEKMRKEYGKAWSNEDIDNVLAAKYYIKYFDVNGDKRVDIEEFERVFQRDLATMAAAKSSNDVALTKGKNKKGSGSVEGRRRDPGFAWILDFNNDGVVSVQEMDSADGVLQKDPVLLPKFNGKDEL